jgi:GGDEF domain-containing protein
VLLLVEQVPRENVADASAAADRDAETLIGRAIRQAIRQGDLIYELEGGTFAVFLVGAPQFEAEKIADRICAAVRDTILLDEALNLAPGAVAIGGAVIASAIAAVDVRKAHRNLLSSRQQGPNSYHIAA